MSTTAIARPDEKKLESSLAVLQQRAIAIVVRDADTYTQACEIVTQAKAYIKRVAFELNPGIEAAKGTLDLLKNQKSKFTGPAEEIIETASEKAERWRSKEKRKAEAEAAQERERLRVEAERKAADDRRAQEAQAEADRKQRQKEIEQAKASGELKAREATKLQKQADEDAARQKELARQQEVEAAKAVPEVKVAAAIPRVAGVKNQTYWKFRVVDATLIPRIYTKPDEVAIGDMVRKMKNKATAEAACPGLEVWSEG